MMEDIYLDCDVNNKDKKEMVVICAIEASSVCSGR